ncbi:MAG: PEP-CTERM sorting domain-containing protein [Acidobacteriota bacterium]|nr:PEP-CTERM sorting domain-containing protein [Acidobacteriota bacterium]
MKLFRVLFVLSLICGWSALAKADVIDFKMNVLDPPSLPYANVINAADLPFSITFSKCQPGEVPSSVNATGCYAGYNDTTMTWNSLQFTFANTPALAGQPTTCGDPTGITSAQDAFGSASCSLQGLYYILTFYGGAGIIPGETFIVYESGPAASAFPTGSAAVNVVPEPTPLLLVATGILMLGTLVYMQRRNLLPAMVRRQ